MFYPFGSLHTIHSLTILPIHENVFGVFRGGQQIGGSVCVCVCGGGGGVTVVVNKMIHRYVVGTWSEKAVGMSSVCIRYDCGQKRWTWGKSTVHSTKK